jgi:hypothetical protein
MQCHITKAQATHFFIVILNIKIYFFTPLFTVIQIAKLTILNDIFPLFANKSHTTVKPPDVDGIRGLDCGMAFICKKREYVVKNS